MTVRAPKSPKGASLPLGTHSGSGQGILNPQPEGNWVPTPTVPPGVGEYGPVEPGTPIQIPNPSPPSTPTPQVPVPQLPLPGGGLGMYFPGASGGGIPVMVPFMPPNGFAGFAQQTAAVQSLYRGRKGGRKRKKRASSSASSPRRRTKKKRAGARRAGAKLKKGSAAAKRYMAKIRKMRKR